MNLLHYGLQRSGTNYLETLLKRNYRVTMLNSNKDRTSPLIKHCRLYRDKGKIPEPRYHNDIVVESFAQFESLFQVIPDFVLVISKDPYSWYLSYQNWAKKCGWPVVDHHYIEEYNLFYKTFMTLSRQSDKFIFIRYVDLIKDEDSLFAELEQRMSLKKRIFSGSELRKPDKVAQSETFSEHKRAYYLKEAYLEEYGEEELQTVNTRLDAEVMSFLGYEYRGQLVGHAG